MDKKKKFDFDSILNDFQPLSEMEQIDEVNGARFFPPIVAAYAVVIGPIIRRFFE